MEWIKCSEKMPDKDGEYLVFAPSLDEEIPFEGIAWYNKSVNYWEGVLYVWAKAITHWMPLPQKPNQNI